MSTTSEAFDKALKEAKNTIKIAKMLASTDEIGWNQMCTLYPEKKKAYINAAQTLLFNWANISEEIRTIKGYPKL